MIDLVFLFALGCLISGVLMIITLEFKEKAFVTVSSFVIVFLVFFGILFSVWTGHALSNGMEIKTMLSEDALYHIHGNAKHDILTMQRIDEERSEVVGPVFLYKIKKGEKVSEIIEPGYNLRYNYGVLERWPPSNP